MNIESIMTSGIQNVEAKTPQPLQTLDLSESVTGKIIHINGENIHFRTPEGAVIKAKMSEDILLNIGETITFSVTGKQDNTVFLSVESRNGNLYVTEGQKDAAAVTAEIFSNILSELKYPITAKNLEQMQNILDMYPQVKPEEAAFITANRLPLDEASVLAALDMLRSDEGSAQLMQNIPKEVELVLSPKEPSVIISGAEDEVSPRRVTENPAPAIAPGEKEADTVSILKALIKDRQPPAATAAAEGKAIIPEKASEAVIATDKAEIPDKLIADTGEIKEARPGNNAAETHDMGLEQHIKEFCDNILDNLTAVKRYPPEKQQAFTETVNAAQHELLTALKSDNPEKALEKFIDKIFANPLGEDFSQELRQAKRDTPIKLELLRHVTEKQVDMGRSSAAEGSINRMTNHTRLMAQSDSMLLAHIPLMLEERQSMCELYIMKEKRGKAIDPEDVRILLAIDTANMGQVHVLLNIQKKQVSASLKIQREGGAEYMKTKSPELFMSLSEIGYRLSEVKAVTGVEEALPLEAVKEIMQTFSEGRIEVII